MLYAIKNSDADKSQIETDCNTDDITGSDCGAQWEPEYLKFPESRDRVIIHRLLIKNRI